MNKKEYKSPILKVIMIANNTQLLAGSGPVEGSPTNTDYENIDVEF